MKTRGDLAERTTERTFSALLEKLGEQIYLSRSQTQIASASSSMSHSNPSLTAYQSQPDVDINTYSLSPQASNCSSYTEDWSQSTSFYSQTSPSHISTQSNDPKEYSSRSYSYSSSDDYYSSSVSYSYCSDLNTEDDIEAPDQISSATRTESSLPRKILRTIIRENPHILSQLRSGLGSDPSYSNKSNQPLESLEYKFSIEQMRKIKEIGEDLVTATQNALKQEARRQREISNRLSRPKHGMTSTLSLRSHRRQTELTPKGSSKASKWRQPAIVLEVPQLNKGTTTSTVCSSSSVSTELSSPSVGLVTGRHSVKTSTQEASTSSEQVDDPLILSRVQRDYLKVAQPVIQEHSPHRLSIPGSTNSTSNAVEQKVHSDILKRSVTSIATPQELLASVALVGSIPDINSTIEAASKQHVASQTSSTNSSKRKAGDSSISLIGTGSRSKPLSSSALEVSRELPEPASRLVTTKSSSLARTQPMIDLTLTTTAPQPGNASTSYRPRSLSSLSQQVHTAQLQSDQVVKELKDKIATLELKLKDEKQRNASTSKELRNLRERKRVLEGQLKKKIEEKDLATWEAQKKALKMNVSLMRTIAAMKANSSSSKTQRKHSHRQVPSHMLTRRDPDCSEPTQSLLNTNLPLIEIAPPMAKLSASKENSIPPSVKLFDSIEQSADVNEIVVCSHKRQTHSSGSHDLNRLFVDTCNKTIRDALADVYSLDSTTIPVFASADLPTLHIETTPPPPIISADREPDSPVDRQKLLESDISPEVTIGKLKSQDTDQDEESARAYTLPVDKQLFQKDLHKNASIVLGNQIHLDSELKHSRPPIAPRQENRARSIRRHGECVALFLLPSPTRYPADAAEITKLIVSISTDISSAPGLPSNDQEHMRENLLLVRELIESPDLSIFNYPLFGAKLIAAMFCTYGPGSFPVFSTVIYRISDLLLTEVVSLANTPTNPTLYEIECRLYTYILNIIRGTCLLVMSVTTCTSLQPGESSLQILLFAFNGLGEFSSSANVFLEDTALYLVVSTSIEALFPTTLARNTDSLSLSTTPIVCQSTGENHQTYLSITETDQESLLAAVIKTVILLCHQMLLESDCSDSKSEVRYYQNHSLCSISSLLHSISALLQRDKLSVNDSALLTQLRRRIVDAIPALSLVPCA
ncbi:Hypothetical protein DHA2_152761 [Giardia duodenalis]|uniref:Uncharacterized protein n=1 Tax=Giardia intestinalis TaxID=5741 RepID=V6TEY3_GIAIN|nr:Hypothetical protein DHA2_152761 [Giardia intestinalis]